MKYSLPVKKKNPMKCILINITAKISTLTRRWDSETQEALFLSRQLVIQEQIPWLWAAKLDCIVFQVAFRVQFYTSHEISCLAPLSPMLFHHMLNQIVNSQSKYFCRAPVLAGNNVQQSPIVTSVSSLHFYKQTFRIGNQSNGSG